jgi:hypothetical protein
VTPAGLTEIFSQRGSVAIVVALFMGVFLTLMMLVLDTGYLYSEKVRQQNGVDAAAQAAAGSLGRSGMAEVARAVAMASGLAVDAGNLTLTHGFYDENDAYAPFSAWREFCPEGAPACPEEVVNSVLVQARQESDGLTGLGGERTVRTAALAYLKRYGLMSLDPEGEIQLGHNSHWIGAPIYAKGKIKVPVGGRCGTNIQGRTTVYDPPSFEEVNLVAEKGIYQCSFGCHQYLHALMEWDNCRQLDEGTVSDPVELPPCDADYVADLGATADEIYTPGDVGNGFISKIVQSGIVEYYVDLAAHDHKGKMIFFDAKPKEDVATWVRVRPPAPHSGPTTIKGMTFITNCDLHMGSGWKGSHPNSTQTWGGIGDDQLVIITSGCVELLHSGADMEGVAFRCGGHFFLYRALSTTFAGNRGFRVAADRSIYLYRGEGPPDMPEGAGGAGPIGAFTGTCDFTFAPPWPPGIVRWGILE